MTRSFNAEGKVLELIDLLRTCGGLRIEATFLPSAPGFSQREPELSVELSGPDLPLLLRNQGELLGAIEQVAAQILRLSRPNTGEVWFDAGQIRGNEKRQLQGLANKAIQVVKSTLQAYRFPPMKASERRLLHLALASSGLKSASTGHSFNRCVVLYPQGVEPPQDHLSITDRMAPPNQNKAVA